jgi:hypothetical protein
MTSHSSNELVLPLVETLADLQSALKALYDTTYAPVVSTDNQRSHTTFTRTKMCTFHLRGMCAHGSGCKYAHDMQELRDQPDLSKTRMCPSARKGKCSKGERCTYAHSRDELRGTDDVYKTAICRFWANGKCVAGDNCRHAHGVSELRYHDDLSRDETRSTILTEAHSFEDVLQILHVPEQANRVERYSGQH